MREKERDMELILASGSPRRRELLSLYTTDFTVCVSDFDESTVTADTPAHLVEQLARGKCLAKDVCICCGACAAECPVEAISEGDGIFVINSDVCIDCGACANTCPVDAPNPA